MGGKLVKLWSPDVDKKNMKSKSNNIKTKKLLTSPFNMPMG
jgi:hypothetical protein